MNTARVSRWLRRILRVAVGCSIFLVLLMIGLGLYTRTDNFHRWLREQLLTVLQSSINGEISLDRVSGSVWEEIRLHGLSIHQNGVEAVSLPRVTVAVHLLPQLLSLVGSSTFSIAHVTLTDPVIRLVQEPETGWNVAHLIKFAEQTAEQPKTSLVLNLFFSHVSVENGQIAVRQAEGKEFQLNAVTVEGDLQLLPSVIRADLDRLNFALAGPGILPLQWSSRVTYENGDGTHRVSIQSADLKTPLSYVQITGTVDNPASPTLALTAEIKQLAADEVNQFLPSPRLRQNLSGTVQVTGPLSALQVGGSLEAPNGRVATAMRADVSQASFFPQGTLTVERLAVDKVLRVPDVAGEVNGQIAFQGATFETLHANIDARASNLIAYGRQIGELAVIGDTTRRQGKFTIEAKGKLGSIFSQWQISFAPSLAYETTLVVRNLDISQVTANKTTPVTDINAEGWIKGSGTELEKFDGAAKLKVLSSQIGTMKITQGDFVGTLRNGQLMFEKVLLLADGTTVNGHGRVDGLSQAPNSELSYSVQATNIAPWLALAGIPGEGTVDLKGSASGTFAALRLEGKGNVSNFSIGSVSLHSGDLTYLLTDVGSPQPHGYIGMALHNVRAGMRLRTVNADLAFAGIRPAEVQANITAQDEELRTHHVRMQTTYESEHLDVLIQVLAIQLPTGTWRATQQPHLVLKNGTLSIEHFELQRADQTVSVAGTLTQQGPLALQVQIDRVSLAELQPLLRDGPDVSGRVNGGVLVQGTAASPDLTVNLTTGALTVAGQSYAGVTAQGVYRHEHFALNLLLRQDENHTLNVEGGFPVALGTSGNFSSPVFGEADFRVHSAGLSLAFLALLSRQIQAVQGRVDMDLRLHGPLHALIPSGPLRIQQGHVQVKSLGQAFTDINVELQFATDAVRLTQFTIRGGEGSLTGHGMVVLQQYAVTNIALTFDASQFRIIDTRQYRAAVSGQLVCSGSFQQPAIKGRFELVDTTLRPDLSLMKNRPAPPDATIIVVQTAEDLLGSTRQTKPISEEDAERPTSIKGNDLYHQLGFDLTLVIPRDTWVQMQEGSIELMGQLRARKEPTAEVSLSGDIETVRGWYAIHGRKFRLERGHIIFTGATPIDPTLDVVARYALPQYQVDLLVGGTAKTPTVTFRSEPQLEQADILSLLLFGKPANALSGDQKATLQSQAVQIVAGSVAADLRRTLAESLGVDDLELDVGENPGQSKVGVGKYIVPGVFVSTSQQLGDKQRRGVAIEYQLDGNWQLKASTTSQGDSGIDILWQKQY